MNKKHLKEFSTLLTKIRTLAHAEAFLKDILTTQEIRSVAERWQIIKELRKGIPHREISKSLKVSIAKVTRGSHALRKSKGGFKIFLKNIKHAAKKGKKRS